jgi:hypothetical protein
MALNKDHIIWLIKKIITKNEDIIKMVKKMDKLLSKNKVILQNLISKMDKKYPKSRLIDFYLFSQKKSFEVN